MKVIYKPREIYRVKRGINNIEEISNCVRDIEFDVWWSYYNGLHYYDTARGNVKESVIEIDVKKGAIEEKGGRYAIPIHLSNYWFYYDSGYEWGMIMEMERRGIFEYIERLTLEEYIIESIIR